MSRKVLKDFTLSDGTVLPAGCLVSIVAGGVHYDPVRSHLIPTGS
jgi:hypothetical protein